MPTRLPATTAAVGRRRASDLPRCVGAAAAARITAGPDASLSLLGWGRGGSAHFRTASYKIGRGRVGKGTGVQTCALPICEAVLGSGSFDGRGCPLACQLQPRPSDADVRPIFRDASAPRRRLGSRRGLTLPCLYSGGAGADPPTFGPRRTRSEGVG